MAKRSQQEMQFGHDDDRANEQETVTEELDISRRKIGVVVGPRGSTVKRLEDMCCVRIATPRRDEGDGDMAPISITGMKSQVVNCQVEILGLLRDADAEPPPVMSKEVPVPGASVPLIVGKRGAVVQQVQSQYSTPSSNLRCPHAIVSSVLSVMGCHLHPRPRSAATHLLLESLHKICCRSSHGHKHCVELFRGPPHTHHQCANHSKF